MSRILSFELARVQYVHRYTMEHFPEWAKRPADNGKFYAPQYRTDWEWYTNTIFPGEPGHDGGKEHCISSGQTWPLGQWLKKPYTKPRPVISISVNGDPYGRGFVGSESKDFGASWIYRGDIGAKSRAWWRAFCKRSGFILRYE